MNGAAKVCDGELVVKGTRVTVRTLLGSLADGASAEQILAVILSGKDGDDAHHYPGSQRHTRRKQMKAEDQYLKFVRWEEEDHSYVGYCPDLFPWGGVCHGTTEEDTYRQLCALVHEEVEQLRHSGKGLPPASTRPMREAVPA